MATLWVVSKVTPRRSSDIYTQDELWLNWKNPIPLHKSLGTYTSNPKMSVCLSSISALIELKKSSTLKQLIVSTTRRTLLGPDKRP